MSAGTRTQSQHTARLTLTSESAADTEALGAVLAPLLLAGDVLPLSGGFGAGKTTFVRGVGRGLGVVRPIVSPSFGLIHSYTSPTPGVPTLYHLDLYRIASAEEAEAFGVEEALFGDGAALIEWPKVIRDILPDQRLDVTLALLDGESREITFDAYGERPVALLTAYQRVLGSR